MGEALISMIAVIIVVAARPVLCRWRDGLILIAGFRPRPTGVVAAGAAAGF